MITPIKIDPKVILGYKTVAELRKIDPRDYVDNWNSPMPVEVIEHIFNLCGALWLHLGDPKAPHAELTSGKCSDGFVDTLRVLRNTNLCAIFAYELCKVIIADTFYEGPIDWVVGSDHAAATLSYRVAEYLGAQHEFPRKVEDENKIKTQPFKGLRILPMETVLQVEELVTTSVTFEAVRYGLRSSGVEHIIKFAPLVATLVHRSDIYEFEGDPMIYLIHFDIKVWDRTECPLCAVGSKRLKPKLDNWAELTGKII